MLESQTQIHFDSSVNERTLMERLDTFTETTTAVLATLAFLLPLLSPHLGIEVLEQNTKLLYEIGIPMAVIFTGLNWWVHKTRTNS